MTVYSVSEDVKDIIVNSGSGLSLVFGVDLFIGNRPSAPDGMVVLNDGYGLFPDRSLGGANIENPTINMYVRNNSYVEGFAQAQELYEYFDALINQTVGTTVYMCFLSQGNIITIGQDELGRYEFSLNFSVKRSY